MIFLAINIGNNMSNYVEDIINYRKELVNKIIAQAKFRKKLSNLKLGQTVYEYGSYGDYFPQIIKEIDIEGCRILTLEESINKIKWRNGYHIKLDNGSFEWIR